MLIGEEDCHSPNILKLGGMGQLFFIDPNGKPLKIEADDNQFSAIFEAVVEESTPDMVLTEGEEELPPPRVVSESEFKQFRSGLADLLTEIARRAGERGERGPRGFQGIQGDKGDVATVENQEHRASAVPKDRRGFRVNGAKPESAARPASGDSAAKRGSVVNGGILARLVQLVRVEKRDHRARRVLRVVMVRVARRARRVIRGRMDAMARTARTVKTARLVRLVRVVLKVIVVRVVREVQQVRKETLDRLARLEL